MDTSSLNAQIVYGSLDFLLQSQDSHIYPMDISFLHAHILYVSLDFLFFLQCNHMGHIQIFHMFGETNWLSNRSNPTFVLYFIFQSTLILG